MARPALASDSSVARRSRVGAILSTTLAIAYPLLAHWAIATHSQVGALVAISALTLILLGPALMRGNTVALLIFPLVAAVIAWLAQAQLASVPLFAPPVLITGFTAWVFGRTLARERTPLILQFVHALHPQAQSLDPAIAVYARRVTILWTVLLTVLALMNLVLALLAEPNGLLILVGWRPKITVALELWSACANLYNYLIIAAMFVVEYAYRKMRFPEQPYRNLWDFVSALARVGPHLWRRKF